MDEMGIKLTTSFMKGVISNVIKKIASKQFGVKPNVQVNELNLTHEAGVVHAHISVDGDMSSGDVIKLLQSVNLL